ncbi:MAG: restriction endonuclease [Candidatus Moranbacteria bacterium]|nr:restriction endonuclease [Candidatus Moranbacteria bacterium]
MAENLTYLEIAYKIFSEEPELKQIHYRDLANKAFDLGLIESDDLIIAGNIASAINADIRKSKSQGTESKFISFGKGLYGLLEQEPKGIFADIRNKNQEVKKQLLEALHAMHPSKFEELVGEVLRNLGFEKVQVTGKTGDGGIDVTGELVVAGIIKNNVSVQVKRWRNNVQRASISELRGSLRPHQTGLFITTSNFSRQSIEEAEDPYKATISLMSGNEFVDLLCEFGVGIILEKVTIFDIDKNEINFDFPEISESDGKEIEIFANYKNHKHFAVYYSPTKIIYENEVYNSPSGAGMKVQNGLPVNGWKFWKFIDLKTGKIHPIERLRKK